jgi:hypothetical protein
MQPGTIDRGFTVHAFQTIQYHISEDHSPKQAVFLIVNIYWAYFELL